MQQGDDSGRERMRWNAQALKNFTDTYGFGAGAGSGYGSGFPGVVLGNLGIVGTLAFGGFFTAVLAGRRDRWKEPYPAACQRAARWACFTLLVGASAAATILDLGLLFFVFAGLACGGPALLPATRPVQADSAAAIPAGCSRSIS